MIAKNQTAVALDLEQLSVPDNEIPASGQVTLTDFASIFEIQDDPELSAHIAAGNVILNIDGVDLSLADSAAWAAPLTVASVSDLLPSPVYVDYYDAGTSDVGSSPTTLGLDTARQSDALFALSSDQVTVQSGGTGDYFVRYEVTFDESDSSNRVCECWLEIDTGSGFSEVTASRSRFSHWDEHGIVTDNTAGRSAILSLSNGDIIRVRGEVTTGSSNYTTSAGGVSLIIMSIGSTGPAGAQGPAGSGSTITVQDGGSTVSGGPHATLNFVGMSATDAGGSVATVAPVYGSEYESDLDKTYRFTNGTAYDEMHKCTTGNKPAGTYRIEWTYIWSYNNTSNNFRCRVTVDDTTQLYEQDDGWSGAFDLHQQEPKDKDGTGDGGTDQRHVTTSWADVTFASSGTHDIDIDISSSVAGQIASVHRSAIAIYRVS
jgi:hypothetical protein